MAALWAAPATLLHTAARPRRAPRDAVLRFVALNLLAGVVVAGLIVAFARVLAIAVDPATVDVRHFSLYPWNGARVAAARGHPRAARGGALGGDAGPHRGPRRLADAVAGPGRHG